MKLSNPILFLVTAFMLMATPVQAQDVIGDDVYLTDSTPVISFDDTDVGGETWAIQAYSEYFRLVDTEGGSVAMTIGENLESMALGYGSVAGSQAAAVGSYADAAGENSLSLGRSSEATMSSTVALGAYAAATAVNSSAIGALSDATGSNSFAAGGFSLASGLNSTALGRSTEATAESAIAVGNSADAKANRAIGMGHFAAATGEESIAIGSVASAAMNRSVALGYNAGASMSYGIALGSSALAGGEGSVVIGQTATAADEAGIAIGRFANSQGFYGVSIGRFSAANGDWSVALGPFAKAEMNYATALGHVAVANGFNSTAVGNFAQTDADNVIVLGGVKGINSASVSPNIGNGVTAPVAPLHIFRDDASQEFLRLDSDQLGVVQDRAMMDLANNGGIRFQFHNREFATGWRFQAQTGMDDRFEVTKVGTGEIEFSFRNDGNLYIAGNLFTNSDVNAKQDIEPVADEYLLAQLNAMPVSEWSYRDAPHRRHLGPMAQDFRAAFGLGENDTSIAPMDMAGVSLAAVKALQKQFQRTLSEKEERISGLEQRLAALEALLTD